MSYHANRHGGRGRDTEQFAREPTGYRSLGQPPIPGGFPGFPGGLPGAPSRAVGPIGPTMPTFLFPTHTRVGDVVTVTGPFAGLIQGQVRVKFTGTSWLSPQMMGPATASVVVPEGAQNGVCEVEVNGRRTFGTNCIIDPGTAKFGRHGGPFTRDEWTQRGEVVVGDYLPVGAMSQAQRETAAQATTIRRGTGARATPLRVVKRSTPAQVLSRPLRATRQVRRSRIVQTSRAGLRPLPTPPAPGTRKRTLRELLPPRQRRVLVEQTARRVPRQLSPLPRPSRAAPPPPPREVAPLPLPEPVEEKVAAVTAAAATVAAAAAVKSGGGASTWSGVTSTTSPALPEFDEFSLDLPPVDTAIEPAPAAAAAKKPVPWLLLAGGAAALYLALRKP